jgi:hypothetical protein
MLYYDVLDEIAESHIPEGMHKMLHVNSRQAWVETMADLIERGYIKKRDIDMMAVLWEKLLYKKYSALN